MTKIVVDAVNRKSHSVNMNNAANNSLTANLATETYGIGLVFVVGDDPTERKFTTRVVIGADDPAYFATDIAHEMLVAKFGEDVEVLYED